ncbi:hypothetical protein [Streptomyces rimosus]|uniref:hypothetical protein n=1 Tax=Streptomyces rimosus TaxID=1927 RepID=UPI0004C68B48|nr:hypothetical protein [Streptomyces rimosus]
MPERCLPCEEHAKLHKWNVGFGAANEPCDQCEQHARMHAAESGCGGALVMLLACAGLLLARKKR